MSYSAEDRAYLTSEFGIWLSDDVILAALFRAGLATPEDALMYSAGVRNEMDTPGTHEDSWFDDLGWFMLRREETRDIIARRVALTAEGVTERDAKVELKRLRDLFRAAIDKRLDRESVVVQP